MAKRSEWKPRNKPGSPVTVEYISQSFAGKGEILDLSEEGLKLQGTHAVHTGMRLAVQIRTTDSATPLHIARAHVRWTKGREFGVRFDALDSTVKAQLLALLVNMASSAIAPKPL